MDLNLDPFIIRFGEFGIRWYGFFMALSMLVGLQYLVRRGTRLGFHEDTLYNLAFIVLFFGIIGARVVYVVTSPAAYLVDPAEIVRIDHGGLSWHGGLAGGLLSGWVYLRKRAVTDFMRLADLMVPGLALGYVLVRIGNIFNGEVLGLPASLLPFERHPAQLYGSAIGLILLLLYFRQLRSNPPPGYLFGSFFFYYSLLRGLVEETFRANPHFLIDVISPEWGYGFATLTQLFTPVFVVLGYLFMRKAVRAEHDRKQAA